jgi:hypothetical protein
MLVMLNLRRIQVEVFVLEVHGIFHRLIGFLRCFRDNIRDVGLRMVVLLVLG